jgi:hypothetical protein
VPFARCCGKKVRNGPFVNALAELKRFASLTGNLCGGPAPKRESNQWQPIAKRL